MDQIQTPMQQTQMQLHNVIQQQPEKKQVFNRKLRHKLLAGVAVFGLFTLVGAIEMQRQQVIAQMLHLVDRMEPTLTTNSADVMQQLSEHFEINTSVEPTVAAIANADKLKKQNDFYARAKNGDVLVVTEDYAFIVDPMHNYRIKNVAPIANNVERPTNVVAPQVMPAKTFKGIAPSAPVQPVLPPVL